MNRQLRRIASRQKYIAPPRVVPIPSLFDEWAVFDGITGIIQKLERGEIEAVNGVPVFQDEKGQWCEVCPALSGWISVWERYDRSFSLDLVQDPLAKLHNKLLYSMPLTIGDVADAKGVLEQQRKIFRKLDRNKLASLAITEQISLLLESAAPNA